PPRYDTPQSGWNVQPDQASGNAPGADWDSDAQPAEPRTPYQTPVRNADAQAEQVTQVPGQQGSFSTYEEWQRQNQSAKKQNKKHPRRRKIVLRIVGGVVAVCFIFGVGIYAGTYLGHSGNSATINTTSSIPADTPKLNISEAASTASTTEDTGLSGDEIYEKVNPSVVSVVASSLQSGEQASGSGVIMSADGYVITNAHVITDENTNEPANKVTIVTSDGQQHKAEIKGYDHQTDLAVLKITDGGTFTAAEFGDSSKIKAGEKAYAIGSPGGVELANSITTGSISAINRDITIDDRVMTLIQTDASINPGNSGGALINRYGQVIGITSAKLGISYYEGLGFAIPIDSAKDVVDQIIAYGHVKGRPAIGVTGYNLSKQSAEYNDVPQGVVVTEVDPRSDAATQGLQAQDIIIGVNGKTITTMDEINTQKENSKAGDKMTLRVYRIATGKTFDITITLADEADLSSSSSSTTTTQQQQNQQNQQNEQNGQQSNGSYFFQIP
ncbi:MAG: S1C family serine protease, partial [Intestinibacillus sp.]